MKNPPKLWNVWQSILTVLFIPVLLVLIYLFGIAPDVDAYEDSDERIN